MVKKLIDLINIAPVLNTLTGKHYKNFKVALEIAELKKEISSKVEFYMTQEKDIADTYAMKDDKGQLIIENGSQIKFENSICCDRKTYFFGYIYPDYMDTYKRNKRSYNELSKFVFEELKYKYGVV